MDLLEQLVFNGTAEKEFEILDGKVKFKLKTLTGKDQMEVESVMKSDENNSPAYVVHKYSLEMLSRSLVSYGDADFSDKNTEDIIKFLLTLSTSILDAMLEIHNNFLKECKKIVSPENITNLSETPSTDTN